MIIMIGGIPCSGKSTLMRNLIQEMGSHQDAHSKGYPTELDNGKLEEAAYNNAKGAA